MSFILNSKKWQLIYPNHRYSYFDLKRSCIISIITPFYRDEQRGVQSFPFSAIKRFAVVAVVAVVAVPLLSLFWASNPEMCFAHVETRFVLSYIVQDRIKFNYTVENLVAKYAADFLHQECLSEKMWLLWFYTFAQNCDVATFGQFFLF